MGVGKYSPTVSWSYAKDSKWFEKNGGGYGNGRYPESECDDDGYDSYGYGGKMGDGEDRSGNTERDYASSYHISNHDDSIVYPLYSQASDEWCDVNIIELRKRKEELSKDPIFKKDIEMQNDLKKLIEDATALLRPIEDRIHESIYGEKKQR